MTWLASDTYITFCKGMPLPALQAACAEQGGRPPQDAGGQDGGWSWITHAAYTASGSGGGDPWWLARALSGYQRVDTDENENGDAEPVETLYLASTPACTCPRGQNVFIPHCPEHPFSFAYFKNGWEQLYFNFGARRESRRGGVRDDMLTRQLLAAGIVGRDAHGYAEDPDFNADGLHTVRVIAAQFGLPSPPLMLE